MSTVALHVKQFGRFEILRKLGRGMSDVYLAHDPAADRKVVLKLIEQSRDPATQMMVDAERRGAAIQQQLHALDPRILEVYEYGEHDGCFFVAMQYAEGRSLAELLRSEGRIDPLRAAAYAAEAASQLATLHAFQADLDGKSRAVVHGDIKPSNIQIGPEGQVCLLDFGIAKAITLTRNLTSHNLGSPAYCSPERLKRAQVDPQADLWALGVSLYEMVAGLPPYQAQTTRKLEELIQARRPPRALPATCPSALRAIVHKVLASDLARRYPSAAAFEADLRAFVAGKQTVAESEERPSWEANTTVEKVSPARKTVARVIGFPKRLPRRRWNHVVQAVLAGIVAGIVCWIPASWTWRWHNDSRPLRAGRDYGRAAPARIAADVELYRRLERQNSFLGALSPVHQLAQPLRSRLKAAANAVLDGYRDASHPDLARFDWHRARTCLTYALELDGTDTDARGKLALCEGYLHLLRQPPDWQAARDNFEHAAALLARSPDPHLGLARVYIYGFRNPGEAAAAFHSAERLGYRRGPRETEQQADGYLYRAEEALRAARKGSAERWLAIAANDLERARNLYEPIAGFSNVSRSLERLYGDQEFHKTMVSERLQRARKSQSRVRRWR
jgi:hypothetical protein